MSKLQLKVKRGELAKEFPLMKVAKYGDVGLDIPIALPYQDEYEQELKDYEDTCADNNVTPHPDVVNEIKHGFITINPGERCLVPTDIRIELPYTHWASIEARSSTSKKSIIVPKGVIDPGYRGELFAQLINVGTKPVTVRHGDRLVQMILHENIINDFSIEEVDELSESERGESGFGSSGQSVIN